MTWLNQKLFTDGDLTVGKLVEKIMKLFLENGLTKKCLGGILELLNYALPQPNNLPKNKYQFLKLLFSLLPQNEGIIVKHQKCDDCSHYLGIYTKKSHKSVCEQCKGTNVNGFFVEYNLEEALKNAFESRNLADLINEHKKNETQDDNFISDFTSASEFKMFKKDVLQNYYDLCLLWSTDGAPISKSSKGEIWPIQIQILNIPPKNRRNFQFLAGMYYSNTKKPNMNTFLKPFSVILKKLFETGFDWFNKLTNSMEHSIVIAPVAPLDLPARAAAQNIMQFNGECGCTACEHPGMTCATGLGHNRVYPPLSYDPLPRTKERMIEQAELAVTNNLEHVKGVKGPTIAATIPCFDIATSFVPDYMHCVLAGVVTMLMNLWFDSKNKRKPFYINKPSQERINTDILEILPPDFTNRTPRHLKFRKYYKDAEIRDFLLNYLPIILKDILPKKYYQHFLLLVCGIRILLQDKISINELELADFFLMLFVQHVKDLYGLEKCSYNVHQLTHMVDAVKRWGPMWVWSTFPFEDGNGYFKKINHGPNKVDMKIVNTIKMLNAYYVLKNKLYTNANCGESTTGCVLGVVKQVSINLMELECLQDLITSHGLQVNNNNIIFVYARAKINNQVFTSEHYRKQKKRNNYTVSWNSSQNFGTIQFFITINGCIFVLLRELHRNLMESQPVQPQIRMDLSEMLVPIRLTHCFSVICLNQIDVKVLLVKNHVCLRPNMYENKL